MAITLDGTNGITTPDVDTDGLTVDTNTLFVDAANNRVGVNNAGPSAALDVFGDINGNQIRLRTAPTEHYDIKRNNSTGSLDFLGSQSGFVSYVFGGADGERLRIDASGNLLVGTTSNPPAAGFVMQPEGRMNVGAASGAPRTMIGWYNGGNQVGTITTTTTNTAYNTTSDYRLKENVAPITDAASRLLALNPVRFNFIADPDTTVDGFLAHEAQAVVPEAVTGEKDGEDMQAIDQSKLVPLLTAALQEALQKIEALEARISALETSA